MQRLLLPLLEDCVPGYGEEHLQVMAVLEILRVESFVGGPHGGRGRPDANRQAILRAFVAKAVLGIATTSALLRRLKSDDALCRICGFAHRWKVPSESTLSRAFASFALCGIADAVHQALVKSVSADTFAINVSRDSTAIKARERCPDKPKAPKEPKKKPGPKKGQARHLVVPTRQERQLNQTWQESVMELPKGCDRGAKKNSKGITEFWVGYKLHVDVADDGFPLSAVTTSASVHDSQVAIPLMKITSERCECCYNLMDKAYMGESIVLAAQRLGIVAIVPARDTPSMPAVPLSPEKLQRFKARTCVERFFSALKDNYGANLLRVRGHPKVHFHLMMGVLAYAALTVLRC